MEKQNRFRKLLVLTGVMSAGIVGLAASPSARADGPIFSGGLSVRIGTPYVAPVVPVAPAPMVIVPGPYYHEREWKRAEFRRVEWCRFHRWDRACWR